MSSKNFSASNQLQNQLKLLQLEYEYEKEEFHKQLDKTGLIKRIKKGICWYPVSLGKNYYNSLNQFTIEVHRKENTDTEHSFEHGRPVCFFTQNYKGEIHYLSPIGYISYAEENTLVITLPSSSVYTELQVSDLLGVQLYFDETTYQTLFEAIKDVIKAKNNRLSELREILSGSLSCNFRSISPIRFPWLNPHQENAVNKVICAKDISVVHGPPGTGKTTTLVEAIYETLSRENQVLVCAQSNTAVDWIAEKLIDRNIKVLRIGNPTRVNDKMLSFTYERRFESHADYPELWSIRKTIRKLYNNLRKSSNKQTILTKIESLKERAVELEIRINESLFAEARVISCTLAGSANRLLTGRKFTTLFIDEAAQALEAACWIPIRKADRVVLAGDHCQLPPTIKSVEAARNGLSTTLMEKIVVTHPESVSLLRIQYRMNEEIMSFPSRWFYHNTLVSAPEVKYRGILDYDTSLVWYDTESCDYEEEYIIETSGRTNKKEARELITRMIAYTQKTGIERIINERIDFGIISPYKSQVNYLRSLLKRTPELSSIRHLITINTIDGFQGQERDVILISLVRSNATGQIGFLTDLRRMNVGITRARMKLILIGNSSTLMHHPFYKALYEYISEKGVVIKITNDS